MRTVLSRLTGSKGNGLGFSGLGVRASISNSHKRHADDAWSNDADPQTRIELEAGVYLAQYSQPETIARYVSSTAVPGIPYVVKSVYGPIYKEIIQTIVSQRARNDGFRVLEYGCGGGMNLLELVRLLHAQGARLANAIGTDFSPRMIEAARGEAKRQLPVELSTGIRYLVARHETLTQDIASSLRANPLDLHNTFDLVLGVNTFRYAHRLKNADACARELFALLRPGGYSIMIDMNRSFRFIGSRMHDFCTQANLRYFVPSIRQYSRPFEDAGLVVTEARTFFCFTHLPLGAWMPDAMEALLLSLCRGLRPTLNTYLSPFAQHSLVIAKKSLFTRDGAENGSLPTRACLAD